MPRPQAQTLLERGKCRRFAGTPILPWKKAVPALPDRLRRSARTCLAHQREICDRQRTARLRLSGLDSIAIAKRVELFDISQSLPGLPFDPGAQAYLEGTIL